MLFPTKISRRLLLAALRLTAVAALVDVQAPLTESSDKPNIVFFLTDDQDVHLESLSYQPLVKKHLIDQGLTYQHHFCTVALCCPSRVNLWTGKAAHNTNVTDVNPPYGMRFWYQTQRSRQTDSSRRLSEVCQPRIERAVSPCLVAKSWIQYILYWETFQCTYR